MNKEEIKELGDIIDSIPTNIKNTIILDLKYKLDVFLRKTSMAYSNYDPFTLSPKEILKILDANNWKRWPEAEPRIKKCPRIAYYYAYYVIKGRWLEAETYIKKHPKIAYSYIWYVMKKQRWPEAEKYMIINLKRECDKNLEKEIHFCDGIKSSLFKICDNVRDYSRKIICDRWPEIEQYLILFYSKHQKNGFDNYYSIVKDKTQFVLDNIKILPELMNLLPEEEFPTEIRNKYSELFKMKKLGLL